MEHCKNQWTLVFADEVEHVMMLNARHEQLGPVPQKNPRSSFLSSDRSEVGFQKSFITAPLFDTPLRNRITGDGLKVFIGSLRQFVDGHFTGF